MELKLTKQIVQALKTVKELQAQMRILTKLIQKQYGSTNGTRK